MRLNGSGLNRAALNGAATFVCVQGAATFNAQALLTSQAQLRAYGHANVLGTGVMSALPTRTTYSGAWLDGQSQIYLKPTHIHAASWTAFGDAQIVSYVIRTVSAEAKIEAGADLTALPQGALGAAELEGSAEVLATATRIRPGRSEVALCTAEIAADALATRHLAAQLGGGATLRAEASIQLSGEAFTRHDAYAVLAGGAELQIDEVGQVLRQAGAVMECTANVSSTAHMRLRTFSNLLYGTAQVDIHSEPKIIMATFAQVAAGASILARPTRVVWPQVHLQGGAEVAAYMTQGHAVRSLIDGSATLCGQAMGIQKGKANLDVTADASATGLRVVLGLANLLVASELTAAARTNVEAYDPPERTMYRPFTDREMRRPFIDREMRRAA